MTDCRTKPWHVKAGKSGKTAPIKIIAIYQRIFWAKYKTSLLSMRCLVCNHGSLSAQIRPHLLWLAKEWEAEDINAYWSANIQKAIPYKVLKTAKCSYTLEKPYGTNSCSCSSGKLSCSIVCSCRGDSRQCCNDQAKADQEREDDDSKTDLDEEKQCQSILIFTWALFVKLNFIVF